jgi:hypothetical protein
MSSIRAEHTFDWAKLKQNQRRSNQFIQINAPIQTTPLRFVPNQQIPSQSGLRISPSIPQLHGSGH